MAEKSVLGAVLLDEQHLHALLVDEQLRPEHFYLREHGAVFEAMLELYEADKKIDHLTVAEQLRENNRLDEVGGPDVVEELVAWVPATGHARDYGRIVREQAQMRALLDATREIQADVLNRAGSPRELVEQAERAMLEVAHDERQKAIRSIAESPARRGDRPAPPSLFNQKSPLTGTPSGFRDLDDITGGFQPGNLVVLAARPSSGQVGTGRQHRQERCARRIRNGTVLAQDVRVRTRPALRRLAGQGSGGRSATRTRRRVTLAEDPRGLRPALRHTPLR